MIDFWTYAARSLAGSGRTGNLSRGDGTLWVTAADPAGREASAALMAQMLNAATPDQKAHLIKKLRGYSSDLTLLASEGGSG